MKEKIKKSHVEKLFLKEQEEREKEHQKFVRKLNKLSRKNPGPLIQWLIDAEQIPEDEDEEDYLEVVNLIKKHKQEIFNKLIEDKKSLDDYKFILAEFKKRNIINNSKFKKVYRRFYVLNGAGLTEGFIDRYFELLGKKENNLKKILLELSKIQRRKGDYSIQLSFASKLIHTVDNNRPIYDSRVAKLFNIKPNYNIKNIGKRINDRVRIYDLLKEKFNGILDNQEIKEIIKDFKKRLKANIGDVKMLDFILWKLGGIVIKKLKN